MEHYIETELGGEGARGVAVTHLMGNHFPGWRISNTRGVALQVRTTSSTDLPFAAIASIVIVIVVVCVAGIENKRTNTSTTSMSGE